MERYAAVCQLNSERCLQLERAQSLAGQFWETYEELCPWLQDTLAAFSQLHLPAIEYETLRRQQEELRVSATPSTTGRHLKPNRRSVLALATVACVLTCLCFIDVNVSL